MSRLVEAVRRAAALTPSDAPPRIALRLRLQIASQIAAAAAGRETTDGQRALAAAHGAGTLGVAPGLGGRDLPSALRLASSLAAAGEWDDHLLFGPSGRSAVWTAWLAAADADAPAHVALRAQLAANELAGRLAGFALPAPTAGAGLEWVHGAAAALAAGLVFELPEDALGHAVAIAIAGSPTPRWSHVRSGARVVLGAEAAGRGLQAARLAAAGAEGPLDLFDDGSDWLAAHAGRPLAGFLTGWGEAWFTDTLSVRATPGAPGVAAAVEAMLELLDDIETTDAVPSPEDVLRIDVDAPLPTALAELRLGRPPGPDDPLRPSTIPHGVARALPLVLAHRRLGPAQFTLESAATARDALGDLAERTHVRHDWGLTLDAFDRLRAAIRIDRMAGAAGIAGLLAAVQRHGPKAPARDGVGASGPPGGGTGLNWADLPLVLAARGEAVDGLLGLLEPGHDARKDPAAWLMRRVARVASRVGTFIVPPPTTLEGVSLEGLAVPLPARIRLLLHGGHVREAEVPSPRGSADRPTAHLVEVASAKARAALGGRADAVLDALLGPQANDSSLPEPPAPRALIALLVG